jgi:flagellar biosynthesis activator protein FlaF
VYSNPLQAYQSVERNTVSGRETEARVLTEAAMKLQYCQKNWDAPDRREKLHEALSYNQRVWSIIQGELLDETNQLPKQLRENILSLSIFIDKRIFNVMAYPEPEKLSIIIKINLNIAAGLRGSAEANPQQVEPSLNVRAV